MKSTHSFLIRCRAVRDGEAERFVFEVEHIQNGEHWRTACPEELIAWMLERSRETPAVAVNETETD